MCRKGPWLEHQQVEHISGLFHTRVLRRSARLLGKCTLRQARQQNGRGAELNNQVMPTEPICIDLPFPQKACCSGKTRERRPGSSSSALQWYRSPSGPATLQSLQWHKTHEGGSLWGSTVDLRSAPHQDSIPRPPSPSTKPAQHRRHRRQQHRLTRRVHMASLRTWSSPFGSRKIDVFSRFATINRA